MAYKIAIIEQDQSVSDQIKNVLEKYAQTASAEWEVAQYPCGDALPLNAKRFYDIFFLDADADGLTIAKEVRRCDRGAIIIFVAENEKHALEGYTVDAAGYLCKPLVYEALTAAVDHALFRLRFTADGFLYLRVKHKILRVMHRDILYIESYGHHLYCHTYQCVYETFGSIRETESVLPAEHFARCNNCYLVNLSKVEGVRDDYVMIGRTELKISRPRKRPFMDALAAYLCVT